MIDYGYCQSEICWGAASPVPMAEANQRAILQGIKNVGGPRVRMAVQVGTWDDLDRAVNLCAEYGVKPLLCIMGNTTLGYDGSVTSYAALCKAVAKRYGPQGSNKVSEYELFNESNNVVFNEPKQAAAGFATYIKAGYAAIKSVQSSAFVLPGGTVPVYDVAFGWAQNPVDWYKALYQAGCKDSMDGIAFHLYCEESPGPTVRQWKYMLDIRDLMVAQGDGAKKIWVTEVGTSYPGPGITSAIMERDWLKTMVEGIESYSYTGPFFIYNYRNSENKPDDSTSSNYGIEYFDGTRKPLKYEYAKTIAGRPADPGDITPPSPPTGFKVVDLIASWSPAMDDVGVTVYKVKNAADDSVVAQTTVIGQTSAPITVLLPGTPYMLYATAIDAAGNESARSNVFPYTTSAPTGLQETFAYDMTSSPSVPLKFTQLGLGFTVTGGVALPNAPTVDGDYWTPAVYTSVQQSPDHYVEITQSAASTFSDRAAVVWARMTPDATQCIGAMLTAGVDAARIVTYDNGVVKIRNAINATALLPGQKLRITAEGNVYTASRVADGSITELVSWVDFNGDYPGEANTFPGFGFHHKRVGGVNYPPPGVVTWASHDLNAVTLAGALEPWMLAIVNDAYWPELIAGGNWQSLI